MRLCPQLGGGLALCFLLSAPDAPRSHGQPGPGRAPTDRYGDPLPEGAVARLGTLRLTHLGWITAVAVSPDGKVAASGVRHGEEYVLRKRVVDKGDGTAHRERIRATRATIRLWDVKTGELLREIQTPDAPVSAIRFAADGKTFFAVCGMFLCRWETGPGKEIWKAEGVWGERFDDVQAENIVLAGGTVATVHPGRLMCLVETDRTASSYRHPQRAIRLWDARSGAPLPLPKALESTTHAQTRIPVLFHEVALSPDLRRAAVLVSEAEPLPRDGDRAFDDKWKYTSRRLEVIDVAAGKVVHSIPDADGVMARPVFSEDGQTLAVAGGKAKEVWLIGVEKGQRRVVAKDLPAPVSRLRFVDGEHIAALSDGNSPSVKVWDVRTGASVPRPDVRPEAFEPARGGSVAAMVHGETVRLVDVASGKPLHPFDGLRLPPSLRYSSHSADTLVSRDAEQAVLWDTRSWTVRQALPLPAEFREHRWWSHYDSDLDHGVSVEKGLYTADTDKGTELRDLRTGKAVRPLEGTRDKGRSCYFAAAGNRLVREEDDGFSFFDVATGKRLSTVGGEGRNVIYAWYRQPELSTRGKYFARTSTTERPAIELYEVDSGKLVRKLVPGFTADKGGKDRSGNILKFHFSPDERLLFGEVRELITMDGGFSEERVSVTVWVAETGETLRDLVVVPSTHVFWRQSLGTSKLGVLAISNDHRLVALTRSASDEWSRPHTGQAIEVWEVASGGKRGELKGSGPVADLAFSPDGRRLASGSDDSTILIWDLDRPLQPVRRSPRLSAAELDECWQALFQPGAVRGESAVWRLVYGAEDSVPFLRKKLPPAAVPEPGQVRKLLADLDSGDYRTRMKADAALAAHGELVLGQLEEAVRQGPGLEKLTRLQSLIARARAAARPLGTDNRMARWRTLEVLERIGSPEATQVVRELAAGAPRAGLTTAARDVLARLEARAVSPK